jgi:hypothetical protein
MGFIDMEPVAEVASTTGMTVQEIILNALLNNAWIIVIICITVVVILYAVIGLLTYVFKWLGHKFENSEYIEFGKFKIKNRNYRRNEPATENCMLNGLEIKRFLTLIDLLISNELTSIIQKVVETLTVINIIENNYKDQCNNIFKTSFTIISNTYHERLIAYACKVSNFTIDKINKTREYFFISEMLHNLEMLWLEKSNDIIKRNGFVEILEDRSRASHYIDELNNCISQAIDIKRMEVTALVKSDIDDIISDLVKETKGIFEDMFYHLGELKKTMIEKKNKKMNQIDTSVKECIEGIMSDITSKLLYLEDDDYRNIHHENNETQNT